MIRRIPVISTLLVLVAVGVMIRLGFWQLDRMHQKEAMLARYQAALGKPLDYLPDNPVGADWHYRKVWVFCRKAGDWREMAGHNAGGMTGWALVFTCPASARSRAEDQSPNLKPLAPLTIVAGWSRAPNQSADWRGGSIEGVVVPGAGNEVRIVADPPLGGLQANARPDPRTIPNNHFAYAVQWFLFAGVALVIYALALRKRLAAQGTPR